MMKKKILILGGSNFQVPIIRHAKERGYHVITCDYLPENPGHKISDEYYNVSTTDQEAVLALAKKLSIDSVVTFSSEPALQTVAYVTNKLGLPGPRLESIIKLTEKDIFRKLLSDIGLRVPKSYVIKSQWQTSGINIPIELTKTKLRYIVKPVDSCGSKGITVLDSESGLLTKAIQRALEHSRVVRCIIEDYIEGDQIHGDGYLQGGKLIYYYFGDHVFYTKTNNRIPLSTRWPSKHSEIVIREIVAQVEAIAEACGYTNGPVNIEARVTPDGEVYIIEVSPRNGGNYVPIIQEHLTGFDFVGKVLDNALGLPDETIFPSTTKKVGAHYILHTERDGHYVEVVISKEIRNKIFFLNVFKQKGDLVSEYVGSNTTIGVVLLEFESVEERDRMMEKAQDHIKVVVT